MTTIHADGRAVWIDGRPRTLLCASLFYFRLPREQWRARLAQVKASGYTCVDVYLPWNFHELAPGQWSFEGRRDVAAFLDLAHEQGLYVIARPGPYICSEWDGGALPAWLGLDPELRVRQNEPRYLEQVTAWFDQALPLLAERQLPSGGPVIMVQLENELDFFDCADREGYVTALRDTALRHGITVPLIACSGQGDIAGATGDVDGVVPACNFYPDDDSPDIEPEVRHYADLLARRDVPLLVTETNRRHRTLRRLLASGAKLIAPYLQASGWNFGYTPSTGNWGSPGNFMSHGYDFGGYVSSTGVERPEFTEARLLAKVLDTWGDRLALATPGDQLPDVHCDFATSSTAATLDLPGGGHLVAVPHLGTAEGTAVVGGTSVAVAPDSCPLMAVGVPLDPWGIDATLALASADLVAAGEGTLVFASTVPVTVVIGEERVLVPVPGRAEVAGATVVVLAPDEAVRVREVGAGGAVGLADAVPAPVVEEPAGVEEVRVRTESAPEKAAGVHALPPALEALGVYRGRGAYRAVTDLTGVDELLLTGAADIVDLTVAGRAHPTLTGFGAARSIGVRDVTGTVAVEAVVEIWGHANFDDARLPALRLGALRGLGRLWKVRESADVSAVWTVAGHWAGGPAPLRTLGGWSSTRVGTPVTYTRTVHAASDAALQVQGVVEPITARVDGGEPQVLNAENPWLLLSPGTHAIALTWPHHPSGPGLRARLLGLDAVEEWSCAVQDDVLLTEFAGTRGLAEVVRLPLALKPGEERWIDLDLPDDTGRLIRLDASQVRVTGWAGGECLGRVWAGERPEFSGGNPDALWVPRGWPGPVTLLARGMEGRGEPEIRTLTLEPATRE
ncbi:beta-galactosidase [Streptomyces niveiscabiei]|uniref:beta-galactosidase n=1 Tax=Streptomyces niveiscabiei TaxID=164115 RepID=UPI0029ADD484|nr:beta-galactosidase [Streptomyces niveiscabiei]MDX3380918.1 beta-galactosidase [Streptomyces niveiscabiei]